MVGAIPAVHVENYIVICKNIQAAYLRILELEPNKHSGFPKDGFLLISSQYPIAPIFLFGDVNFSHSAKTVLPTFGKRQFVFTTGYEYMIFSLRILTINLRLERKLIYFLCIQIMSLLYCMFSARIIR